MINVYFNFCFSRLEKLQVALPNGERLFGSVDASEIHDLKWHLEHKIKLDIDSKYQAKYHQNRVVKYLTTLKSCNFWQACLPQTVQGQPATQS